MTAQRYTDGAGIRLEQVEKTFPVGQTTFRALKGVNLEVAPGELAFVVGRSGSGKSTLLNLIAGLERPTAGRLYVAGADLTALDEDGLARFRGEHVGVVFQFFQLLPTLTSLENVMLAMDFVGRVAAAERRDRAQALLQQVGVADQADKLPTTLSGGQQQRVAIARALANDPSLIVADEPTGNLDRHTADAVMALFAGLVDVGKTVVVVTHQPDAAKNGARVIRIEDGEVR